MPSRWMKTLRDLEACINKHGINFHEPEFCLQLAKTMLKVDFGLKLEMPTDHLIPTITNRYKYVHWVRELMRTTNPTYAYEPDEGRKICGLDVGVGSSCIYGLLVLVTEPSWTMLGTDIDAENIACARKNVKLNDFDERCKIFLTDPEGPLIPLDFLKQQAGIDCLDFVMTNPPFFADIQEWKDSLAGVGKALVPKSNCTGNENEMVTDGGDVKFILRMIEESLTLKEKTTTPMRTWFTSLLGKKYSLNNIVTKLRELGCNNYAIRTMVIPGSETRRWFIGWSWGDLRPSEQIARTAPMTDPTLLPPCTLWTVQYKPSDSSTMLSHILTWIHGLDLSFVWDPSTCLGIGKAKQNVWCRHYRRRHRHSQRDLDHTQRFQQKAEAEATVPQDAEAAAEAAREKMRKLCVDDEDVVLGFKIEALPRYGQLRIRWMQGRDHQLFGSFCSGVQAHLRNFGKVECWSGIKTVQGPRLTTVPRAGAEADNEAEDEDMAELDRDGGGDEEMGDDELMGDVQE